MGTDDEDGLRLRTGKTLPASWAEPLQAGRWVMVNNSGLAIEPPHLAIGEVCTLHFAVATKRAQAGAEDISPWMAVDAGPWARIAALGDALYTLL